MPGWTVVRSSEFIEQLEKIHAGFASHYRQIINTESRGALAKEDLRLAEFECFTQMVVDLRHGHADPTKVLRYCCLDSGGVPIYGLIYGRWRALYRVNEALKECKAIAVDELKPIPRLIEEVRWPFRKALQ